jgi:hypothetical protein
MNLSQAVSGGVSPGSGTAALAPHEPRAPTANLSPTKRAALIACVKGDGTLHKRMGVWKSPAASPSPTLPATAW